MYVSHRHPQATKRVVVSEVYVFDCLKCGRNFRLSSGYVQPDGSLYCRRCSEVDGYQWCPRCEKAKERKEFQDSEESRFDHHPWCLDCVREDNNRTRTCEHCAVEFEGRSDARYCSTRCRVAAHRQREKC